MSVSRDTVINWESGKRTPKIDALSGLASALGVSPMCLLGEETLNSGMMGKDSGSSAVPAMRGSRNEAFGEYRSKGDISGVVRIKLISSGTIDLPLSLLPDASRDSLSGMYMNGDSMAPKIRDGDLVVFCPHETDVSCAGVLMMVAYNGRTMPRGIVKNKSGVVTMKSFNRDYEDVAVTVQDEFEIVGRVLAVLSVSYPDSVL